MYECVNFVIRKWIMRGGGRNFKGINNICVWRREGKNRVEGRRS